MSRRLQDARTESQPDLDGMAARIAEGKEPFPRSLCPADAEDLRVRVSERLRRRLVATIVRAIADDFDAATEPPGRIDP